MIIYKYKFEGTRTLRLEVPHVFKVLHVDSQYNKICAWITFNKHNPKSRTIELTAIGTGVEFGSEFIDENYLGTVKLFDDSEIYHIFLKYL